MSRPHGIDVSNNNGSFNWEPWKGHITFAMTKATEGTGFKDSEFKRNWSEMADLDILRFAYHYGHTDEDPGTQAAHFLEMVKDNGGIRKDDNFVLDFEVLDGDTPAKATFWAYTFCHEVNRMKPGHRTIVYTDPAIAAQGACAMLGGHPLWIANYDVPAPHVPLPWHSWAFWQYAPGIASGAPDQNVFNGSLDQLKDFCNAT